MIRMITTPKGDRLRLGSYVAAWHRVRQSPPNTPVEGWQWWPVPAWRVLDELRAGIHDRINRHVPGYGEGRKWDTDWERVARHTAREVNTPRLVVRWAPRDLRARLAHRLEQIPA